MNKDEKFLFWFLIGFAIMTILMMTGCTKKVEYIEVERNVTQKMPNELFNCETLKRPNAKSEADVLRAYTEAFRAYKSCKNALDSVKTLNERM